jgi:hypothetical protein
VASDTTPDAAAAQRDVWRRLGPTGRVAAAIEASEAAYRITRAGILARHPGLDPERVVALLVRRIHGIELDDPPA